MTGQPDWERLLREGRFEDFLNALRDSAKRASEAAAQRPNWDQLADALLEYREAVHGALLDGDQDSLSSIVLRVPVHGSPLELEADELLARRLNPRHALLQEQLQTYAGVLVDLLHGLSAVMLADPPMRPALVLSRVLLDVGAQVMYLLDPAIGAQERSVRAANIRLQGLAAELQDNEGSGGSRDEALRLSAEMAALWEDGAADGLERLRSKAGKEQRYFSPAPPNAGAMTDFAAPGLGPQMWRLLSSVVHAQDRSAVLFATGRGDVPQVVQGRAYGAMYTGAGVVAATESLSRLVAFYGLNSQLADDRASSLKSLWIGASGLSDN